MSLDSKNDAALRQLCALMDGEADSHTLFGACKSWRDDASMRMHWHRWHLIGDVLRSEDLASDGWRDERLFHALRERLALEPVVVAPLAATGRNPARNRVWSSAAAVAAGFVVVAAAALIVRHSGSTAEAGAQVVQRDATVTAGEPAVAGLANAEPEIIVVNGQLIRDARLDRYLAAHRPLGGATALTLPSNFTREAAVPAAPSRTAP